MHVENIKNKNKKRIKFCKNSKKKRDEEKTGKLK